MRKYGLYLLIAMSLMTGCQKKDIVTVDTAAETTQESGETGSTANVSRRVRWRAYRH